MLELWSSKYTQHFHCFEHKIFNSINDLLKKLTPSPPIFRSMWTSVSIPWQRKTAFLNSIVSTMFRVYGFREVCALSHWIKVAVKAKGGGTKSLLLLLEPRLANRVVPCDLWFYFSVSTAPPQELMQEYPPSYLQVAAGCEAGSACSPRNTMPLLIVSTPGSSAPNELSTCSEHGHWKDLDTEVPESGGSTTQT